MRTGGAQLDPGTGPKQRLQAHPMTTSSCFASDGSAASGQNVAIRVDEVALGYQEMLGAKLNEIHCIRCHDSESTAEITHGSKLLS